MPVGAGTPSRHSVFLPLIIATMLMTLVGASAGFALSGHAGRTALAPRQPSAPAAPTAPPAASDQRLGARVEPVSVALACPPATVAAARNVGATGPMVTVAQFTASLSTLWVCTDGRGRLFLHGDRPAPDGRIEGETPFVVDPVPSGAGYVARVTDDNRQITTIAVNPVEFSISPPEILGAAEVQDMVRVRRWAR